MSSLNPLWRCSRFPVWPRLRRAWCWCRRVARRGALHGRRGASPARRCTAHRVAFSPEADPPSIAPCSAPNSSARFPCSRRSEFHVKLLFASATISSDGQLERPNLSSRSVISCTSSGSGRALMATFSEFAPFLHAIRSCCFATTCGRAPKRHVAGGRRLGNRRHHHPASPRAARAQTGPRQFFEGCRASRRGSRAAAACRAMSCSITSTGGGVAPAAKPRVGADQGVAPGKRRHRCHLCRGSVLANSGAGLGSDDANEWPGECIVKSSPLRALAGPLDDIAPPGAVVRYGNALAGAEHEVAGRLELALEEPAAAGNLHTSSGGVRMRRT